MKKYYVGTIRRFKVRSMEEEELIQNLADEDLESRFPFEDPERRLVEVYKIGTEEECKCYKDSIDEKIQEYFIIDVYNI